MSRDLRSETLGFEEGLTSKSSCKRGIGKSHACRGLHSQKVKCLSLNYYWVLRLVNRRKLKDNKGDLLVSSCSSLFLSSVSNLWFYSLLIYQWDKSVIISICHKCKLYPMGHAYHLQDPCFYPKWIPFYLVDLYLWECDYYEC